jgi:hypothetical protein
MIVMRRYRQFIACYERYVVFVEDGKAYTRRLYKKGEDEYYFRFQNSTVTVSEKQLYF